VILFATRYVIALPGNGPKQEVIGTEDTKDPSLPLYSSNVPQKAKAVLVDPVVLLMDTVNDLVIRVSVGQELHKSPPDRTAPTNSKSLEVQDLASGNV
jgi:hypothetical protein